MKSNLQIPWSHKFFSNSAGWAVIPLRLIVGFGFMHHGYSKIVNGHGHFEAILNGLGVPLPELMSWITILVELVCGFAMLLGAFVPIAIIPMAATMLTAMFLVHLPFGFSSIKLLEVTPDSVKFGPPGYEVNLLYLACLVAVMLIGPGPVSIDNWRRRTKRINTKI